MLNNDVPPILELGPSRKLFGQYSSKTTVSEREEQEFALVV